MDNLWLYFIGISVILYLIFIACKNERVIALIDLLSILLIPLTPVLGCLMAFLYAMTKNTYVDYLLIPISIGTIRFIILIIDETIKNKDKLGNSEYEIFRQYDKIYKYVKIYNNAKKKHGMSISASEIVDILNNELREYQVKRDKIEGYRAEWNIRQKEAERNREIESAWYS